MRWITEKIAGLKKRFKCISYGILYLKEKDFSVPEVMRVNGSFRRLEFLDRKSAEFVYEFTEICLNDCYRLDLLKKEIPNVKVIVDIGANQGLFCIAARTAFKHADIFAYEPNPELSQVLTTNLKELTVTPYFEAVTNIDCKVDLQQGITDLHATTVLSDSGFIEGTSFRRVLERVGGRIDILKIDCEGGEWAILDEPELWGNVLSLTMEYHLWAKPGSSVGGLKNMLEGLGFVILSQESLSETFGLITAVRK